MARGYWAIRTYISGCIGEKIKFWIPGEKPSKSKRKVAADIKKQEQNEKQSERNLARILNANFEAGDMLVGLDYDEESYEKLCMRAGVKPYVKRVSDARRDKLLLAAEEEFSLCLRRVQREAKKDGIEVKVVAVTSDMDGETGELKRVHHHVVVNREAAELFQKKWGKCRYVDFEKLRNEPDRTGLAHYLMAQRKHIDNAKAYQTTRNLIRPKGKDRIAINESELKVPRGAVLLHRSEYTVGFSQYIRYVIPERTTKKKGARKNESNDVSVFQKRT